MPSALAFAILAGDLPALIEATERAEGVAARRYALTVLEQGLRLADPGTVGTDLRDRARALGVRADILSLTERSAPLHAVRIPLVDVPSGRALVRTFFASFDAAPDDRSGRATETDAALREAFDLARKLAGDPKVRPIRWVAAQPRVLDQVVIEGESLAAGALVSAYALLTGSGVRPDVAITGTLHGERVGPVGQLAQKRSAASASGIAMLIAPAAETQRGAGITGVSTVAALLEASLLPERVRIDRHAIIEAARAQAARGWRGFRWPEALERLERAVHVVPDGDLDTRVELLARLGGAERHAGSLRRSEALLEEALRIARGPEGRREVTDATRALAERNHAMTALQRGFVVVAEREAQRALKTARRARSLREEVKAWSVVGLVARGRGDDQRAVDAFEAALAIDVAIDPGKGVRSRAYLAEALARRGSERAAARHYEAALEGAAGSLSDEAWVRTAFGNGLLASGLLAKPRLSSGRVERARAVLDHPVVHDAIAKDPLPGLRARRLLGTALLATERARAAQLLLGAIPQLAMEPGIRRHAALCVLVAWHAGIAHDELGRVALPALDDDFDGRLLTLAPRARDEALRALIARHDRLG